jgi:lipopolysaccharide transport system permease protein
MTNKLSETEQEERAPAAPAVAAPQAELPAVVIEPRPGWHLLDLAELWGARELIVQLAWRDVQIRYKQTALGVAWALLQPGMNTVVFSLFLGKLAGLSSGELPYPLFVFSGLLPWFFFSTGLANAANSVVDSERLITKVYFPRLAIPFAAVGPALVDFCLAIVLLLILIVVYACQGENVVPSWQVLLVPVPMFLILLFALGVGTLFAALNVAYRDFRYVIPFLLQLSMFGTPSIYYASNAGRISESPWINWFIALNPMNELIVFFRAALFGQELNWGGLAGAAGLVSVALAAGCFYFRRVEDGFADII